MAATTSTIPAVLDELVARTRLALPDVQVIDGPPVEVLEGDVIFIGFTGVPGEPAVTDVRSARQYATSPNQESYDVACLLSSWPGGDTDMKAARDRAYGLLDAMASVLAKTPPLGGLVKRARISADTLIAEQTTKGGAVATIAATVHIDADTR